MILTAFECLVIMVGAVLIFKLGFECGKCNERLSFLERFEQKGEENSKNTQNTSIKEDVFQSDLQKIMMYTGEKHHE